MSELSEKLKIELMGDYHDPKFPKKSLIEIYLRQRKYYESLVNNGKVNYGHAHFLKENESNLVKAERISIDAFRKLEYEFIIEKYSNPEPVQIPTKKKQTKRQVDKDKSTAKKVDCKSATSAKPTAKRPVSAQAVKAASIYKNEKNLPNNIIRCPDCGILLNKVSSITIKHNGSSLFAPRYACSKCRKVYTSMTQTCDGAIFMVKGQVIHNLNPSWVKKIPQTSSINNSVKVTEKKPISKEKTVLTKKQRQKQVIKEALREVEASQRSQNKNEVSPKTLDNNNEKKMELRKKMLLDSVGSHEVKRNTVQSHLSKSDSGLSRYGQKVTQVKKMEIPQNRSTLKMDTIRLEDFVIRSSTFKCLHEGHHLENIDGVVNVLMPDGNEITIHLPAGYCPQCNLYIIMDSTFKNMKKKYPNGVLMCRISDEKSYLKAYKGSGLQSLLAPESILKQYGYNVSSQEGLLEIQRRRILQLLIDRGIISKTDVISYLDFFIRLNRNQYDKRESVEKWRADRKFISEYRPDKYTMVGIRSITRK